MRGAAVTLGLSSLALALFPLVLGVVLLGFAIVQLAPGDPVQVLLGRLDGGDRAGGEVMHPASASAATIGPPARSSAPASSKCSNSSVKSSFTVSVSAPPSSSVSSCAPIAANRPAATTGVAAVHIVTASRSASRRRPSRRPHGAAGSMIAGMRLLGLIRRNSGLN